MKTNDDRRTQKLEDEASRFEELARQKRAQAQKARALAKKAAEAAERKALAELKHRLGGFILAAAEKDGIGRRVAGNLRQPFLEELQKLADIAQRDRLLAVFDKYYKPSLSSAPPSVVPPF